MIALLDFDLRKSRRVAADEPETATSLLEHRARRLFADWRSMFRRVSHRLLPRRIPAHDAAQLCSVDNCGPANREQITDFDGLARRSPFLAFAMLIGMISLAGVPFTAGFLGKFFIFYAAILQHQTALVVIGVITVGCGFYYYLKVVRAMYWQSAVKTDRIPVNGVSRVRLAR